MATNKLAHFFKSIVGHFYVLSALSLATVSAGKEAAFTEISLLDFKGPTAHLPVAFSAPFVSVASEKGLAAVASKATPSGFLGACTSAHASPALKHTVNLLLAKVQETDCQRAFAKLRQQKILVIRFAHIKDLTPLADLTNLTYLSLGGNEIEDITPLHGLVNLTELNLGGLLGFNAVKDLGPLTSLIQLRALHLNKNAVDDVRPLAGLVNLEYLNLARNNIVDLSPLAGLTKLKELHAWGNRVQSIACLSSLSDLRELNLNYNKVSDITPLLALKNLRLLWLRGNKITDASPLIDLARFDMLLLSGNPLPKAVPLPPDLPRDRSAVRLRL